MNHTNSTFTTQSIELTESSPDMHHSLKEPITPLLMGIVDCSIIMAIALQTIDTVNPTETEFSRDYYFNIINDSWFNKCVEPILIEKFGVTSIEQWERFKRNPVEIMGDIRSYYLKLYEEMKAEEQHEA